MAEIDEETGDKAEQYRRLIWHKGNLQQLIMKGRDLHEKESNGIISFLFTCAVICNERICRHIFGMRHDYQAASEDESLQ